MLNIVVDTGLLQQPHDLSNAQALSFIANHMICVCYKLNIEMQSEQNRRNVAKKAKKWRKINPRRLF